MTYKIKTYFYACNGPSCLECEEFLPGLQTEHGGTMEVTSDFFKENEADIVQLEANCPRSAISIDEIS